MKILGAVLIVLVLLLGGLTWNLKKQNAAAAEELARLKAANDAVAGQLAEAQAERVDPKDLERLKREQQEAIRLRGELTNLKQQVSNANSAASAAQRDAAAAEARSKAQAARAAEAQAQTPEPRVYQSKANAIVGLGHSLVLGGWPTGTGTVTYAFISSTLPERGMDQVLTEAKYVELPEGAAARLSTMQGAGSNGQFTLTPDQMQNLLKQWEQIPGAKVIGSPRIITLSGRQGSVSFGSTMQTPNGPVHLGPQVDILPKLTAEGSQVQLNIDAKLGVAGGAAP